MISGKPHLLEESEISPNMVRSLRTGNQTTSYQNSTETPVGTTSLFVEEESTTVTEQTTTDHDENATEETTTVGNDDATTESITTTTSDEELENITRYLFTVQITEPIC